MKCKSKIHSVWRYTSHLSLWIFALVIVLVLARIALPFAVKSFVNHKLNGAQDYSGKIGDVDIGLWRGGYKIHQIRIIKKTGDIQSPLFSATEVDLSVEWRELFHGAVVGEVTLRQPQVNFVMGPTPVTNPEWPG